MKDLTTAKGVEAWIEENARTLIKGQDGWQEVWADCERIAENERLRQHIERHAADDDSFWQPACQAYLEAIKGDSDDK